MLLNIIRIDRTLYRKMYIKLEPLLKQISNSRLFKFQHKENLDLLLCYSHINVRIITTFLSFTK